MVMTDGHDDDDDGDGVGNDNDDDGNYILTCVVACFKQIIYIYARCLARKLKREVLVFFLRE